MSAEELWRAHINRVRSTNRDAPNEGLSDEQVSVLLESEDSEYITPVMMPSGQWRYKAQRTTNIDTVQGLQGLGLVQVLPKPKSDTADGALFAWTPVGIKLVQELMKRRVK